MKKLFLAPVALAAVAAALLSGVVFAQEGPPAPSAGTVLAGDLLQPRGITIGPDGMIYVAEAGTGGDAEGPAGPEGGALHNGFTGRVSKIDPGTGERTTVVDGLPSAASDQGEAIGVADVKFIGTNLYVLITHGGAAWGFDDWSTGIYRIGSGGNLSLVADIGAFNEANPTEAISSGAQADVEAGGNPYSMIVRNGIFYVSDGNHNRLLKVTTGGAVSGVAEFPDHPVSTGVADTGSGPFYVAYLGKGPFLPDAGKVVSVDPSSGAITELASGVAMLTDVQKHANGQLYALQFNDPQKAGAAFFAPGTGSVQKVNADGTMTTLIAGLSFATDMIFDGDTAYIANFGIAPIGQIIKVANFSTVQAPAEPTPEPTAAPTQAPAPTPTAGTGIAGPDTGSGGYLGRDGGTAWPTLLVLAALAAAGTGAVAFGARRR